MTWASIIKAVLEFLSGLFAAVRQAKDEELGRLKERERQDEANRDLADRIRDLDPNRVLSDDEAFGAGGKDNHLPGPIQK